jgi:hypothetical protein
MYDRKKILNAIVDHVFVDALLFLIGRERFVCLPFYTTEFHIYKFVYTRTSSNKQLRSFDTATVLIRLNHEFNVPGVRKSTR